MMFQKVRLWYPFVGHWERNFVISCFPNGRISRVRLALKNSYFCDSHKPRYQLFARMDLGMDARDDVSASVGVDWPSVAIQGVLSPQHTPQFVEVTNI